MRISNTHYVNHGGGLRKTSFLPRLPKEDVTRSSDLWGNKINVFGSLYGVHSELMVRSRRLELPRVLSHSDL
ncbi:MAG: hypothetical protein OXD38_08450, partial [Aestuariivita sp.]|nr:hypothetical protein [Aestuariivita sp.]